MGPPGVPDVGPIRFRPIRTEPRGEFPAHGEPLPRPPLSARAARRLAWERLREWRRDHG